MKKKRWLFFALIFAFMFSHVAFSEYLVSNPLYEGQVNEDPEEGQHKVTFIGEDGQIKKTMYVDDGYTLRLRDAPYYASGSEYSRWTSNVLNNRVINDHIEVTSDMGNIEFRETTEAPRDVSATYNEDLSTSATSNEASILKNQVSITDYGISGTITCNISVIDGSRSYRETTHSSPKVNGVYDGINVKLNNGSRTLIGDFSIGLESTGEPTSAYKPNTGGTSFGAANSQNDDGFNKYSTNYCVTKITLQTDVVLMGGITLGAMTGYYGANATFSQYNFQGFIMGSYSELDLNGYDFIVENGGFLDAWGSVTDSSRYKADGSYNENLSDDKKGHLILRSGSTLWTCFVIEDYYRPDSIITSYINGSACFTMYRTPYIDCDTYLYPGCNYYGKLRVDLAGSGNDGISGDILLFGNEGLISFSSKNNYSGYISRFVSYDNTMFSNKFSYWRAIKNIQHQKITYAFYDCEVQFGSFDFEIEISNVDHPIRFYSDRSSFFVSPYYNLCFYNTKFTLSQQIFFMPGSYVFFDSKSNLTMTWSTSKNQALEINFLLNDVGNTSLVWQATAGITFLPYIYPRRSNDSTRYIDVADEHGKEISDYSTTYNKLFWDYVNNMGSHCDFYGTIQFAPGQGSQNHPISFGGNINVFDMQAFQDSVNQAKSESSIQIDLISNNFLAGPNYSDNKIDLGLVKIDASVGGQNHMYVSNFLTTPMISNGYVVADISSQMALGNSNYANTFASDKITYNALDNIYTKEDQLKYAFFYNNNNSSNLYKSHDFSQDNLAGVFRQVYPTANARVFSLSSSASDNSQNYICFNGMMIHVDSAMKGQLPKFCGSMVDTYASGTIRNGSTNYTFSLLADSDFWGVTLV